METNYFIFRYSANLSPLNRLSDPKNKFDKKGNILIGKAQMINRYQPNV